MDIPRLQYCEKYVPPKKKVYSYCDFSFPIVKRDQSSDAPTTPDTDQIITIQVKTTSPAIALSQFSDDLNMKRNSKFTLNDARTVDNHTLTDYQLTSADQIPHYILKTLMIVNYHAREFKLYTLNNDKTDNTYDSDTDDEDKTKDSDSDKSQDEVGMNPMDGLLWVFHCSDNVLRRNLAIKLSACQLSVPFLLPDPKAPSANVTILLSALENITKSWKSASNNENTHEVFATEHPFPVVSFFRMSENTMSKSFLINKIMSDGNGDHNFFFHKNMQGGNVKRKVVDGLVELSWYLPGGSENQTLQSEICFANLRGDARKFKKQFDVLLKISSIICILLPSEYPDEYPDEPMMTILKDVAHSKAKIILLFNKERQEKTKEYFSDLRNEHRAKLSLITREHKSNEHDFLQSIREKIQTNIHAVKATPLVELASCASEYGINLDGVRSYLRLEKCVETWLEQGIKEAKNLFKLQMHVPKLADLEREKYHPRRQRNKSKIDRKRNTDEIYKDIEAEKEAQKESFAQLDERILHYLHSITVMEETERNCAMNKMKLQLDKMSLQNLAKLHREYRDASLNRRGKNERRLRKTDTRLSGEEHLKQLEELITKSSFGLEHIFRELAQLYQLSDISTSDYAGAAAEMLLSGQVLELLDGDSSYIPLQWFNAVYTKLERKTNNAKIFVISVLGIQSSGKSTLLNTMFGLEFPVSAGRCTRGAFVSIIPVSDSLKTASNFEYVLIIDTEGLTGSGDPQLREHDNQLATFAIGVADVAIVNVFGENHNEMKEFLQIAVHAFLKMQLVKEKKSCKIVHQNVAASDAIEKLTINRFHLKQDLDKMAKLAATQENCEDKFQKFDDIISFDEKEDVFYIPNLLKGSPPMAPVNPNYGRAVQRIKENIVTVMCSKERFQISVSHLRERVTNLWKAMLMENLIFSFRNTIEVRAFTSLDRKYFDVSVNLMVIGMGEFERKFRVTLSRCATQDERKKIWEDNKGEIRKEAEALGTRMKNEMTVFFETSEDKTTLEQWKQNVMNKIVQFKENQITEVGNVLKETLRYWQNRQDVDEKKQIYEKRLLQKAKKFITSVHSTDDAEKSKAEFQKEWQQWIVDVPQCQESKIDVNSEMVDVLCDTSMVLLNAEMAAKLTDKSDFILNFMEIAPIIDINQLSISYFSKDHNYIARQQEQVVSLARTITDRAVTEALDFAKMISKSGVRCTRNDLTRMYHKVITTINEETEKSCFKFRKCLKCDILLYTFAKAYKFFDEIEERCFQERDIRGELERNLQPRLETYFLNLCGEMERDLLAATSLVDILQTPIESELKGTMGSAVTGALLKNSMYQSKGPFHASVLIQLGEEGKFESYIPYLENPVIFLRNKLMESIESYCLKQEPASSSYFSKTKQKR